MKKIKLTKREIESMKDFVECWKSETNKKKDKKKFKKILKKL